MSSYDLMDFPTTIDWIEDGKVLVHDIDVTAYICITDHIEPDWMILGVNINGHNLYKGQAGFERLRTWVADQCSREINDAAIRRAA